MSRYQSVECQVIYEIDSAVLNVKSAKVQVCKNCSNLVNTLRTSVKRKLNVTPTTKAKRIRIESNFPLNDLTPRSRKIKLSRVRNHRLYQQKKITNLQSKIEEKEIELDHDQSQQMKEIVGIINTDHTKDLEKVLNDTPKSHDFSLERKVLRQCWQRDSENSHNRDKTAFLKDQKECETGKTSNRWNMITYRIALAIYSRSHSAYTALKKFDILHLPSEKTLQEKLKKYNSPPGLDTKYLEEQSVKYKGFQDEKVRKGEKKPLGEGVMVFDEVKVIEQVIWNSRSNKFMGLALDDDQFRNIHDIFSDTKKSVPRPAQYILQFLWRDLTSKFDVIGPYYSSCKPVRQNFIIACIYDVLPVFQALGFITIGLVCDGASENLSSIKLTMGLKGAFGFKISEEGYDHKIIPRFKHPFLAGRFLFWVICPSHQLKNVIGQLYASREKGPKKFERNGIGFGWKQVADVKLRDDVRVKNNQLRAVKGLLDSFIIRDAWTKLNVVPSKIMQQQPMLSELYGHYLDESAESASRKSTYECYKYLKASHELFEKGFLDHGKISIEDNKILNSINQGHSYFEDWLNEILEHNPEIQLTSSTQKTFLSWQTWDLLRICVHGLNYLVEDFLSRNPTYFISPIRINGSAVESLFSQFKYAAGSKLSSVNYSTARKAVIYKSNTSGGNASNKSHRDMPLYIREGQL